MDKFNPQEYRNLLKEKIVNVPKEERAGILGSAKETPEYKMAYLNQRMDHAFDLHKDKSVDEMENLSENTKKYFQLGKEKRQLEIHNENPENLVYETEHVSINLGKDKEGKFIIIQEYSLPKDISWDDAFGSGLKESFGSMAGKAAKSEDDYNFYFLARTYQKDAMERKDGVREHHEIKTEFLTQIKPMNSRLSDGLDKLDNKVIEVVRSSFPKADFTDIGNHDQGNQEKKFILNSREKFLKYISKFYSEEEIQQIASTLPAVLLKKGEKTVMDVVGGGFIKMNENNKLDLYGKSGGFGSVKHHYSNRIKNLLEKELPGKIKSDFVLE